MYGDSPGAEIASSRPFRVTARRDSLRAKRKDNNRVGRVGVDWDALFWGEGGIAGIGRCGPGGFQWDRGEVESSGSQTRSLV